MPMKMERKSDALVSEVLCGSPAPRARVLSWPATANMRDTMVQNLAAVRKAPISCSIPVTVIASGKRWLPTDEWNDKFDAARKSLVQACPNRHLIVAEGSGHMVTQESPQLVLTTIEGTVDEVRKRLPEAQRCAQKAE